MGMQNILIALVVCLVIAVVAYAVHKDKSVELNIYKLVRLTIKSDHRDAFDSNSQETLPNTQERP